MHVYVCLRTKIMFNVIDDLIRLKKTDKEKSGAPKMSSEKFPKITMKEEEEEKEMNN